MEKFDVSVVLPLKSSQTPNFKDLFDKAIKSLLEQKTQISELVIVHTDETTLVEYLESYDFTSLNVVKSVWKEKPNFASQVNHGVEISSSNWVSIFEFDDEYSNIWFKNVKKYSEVYSDVDVFLPIVVDTDDMGKFVGFTNEATFALNITSDMGILSNEVLQDFQNFQTAGMVIKKKSFIDFGGFKPSFKLTFSYELFLRLTHNSLKIMSIPRIGYKHTNLREGSIFWNYRNGEDKISQDEAKFWIDSAKKEYYFIQDRQIKFEPQTI